LTIISIYRNSLTIGDGKRVHSAVGAKVSREEFRGIAACTNNIRHSVVVGGAVYNQLISSDRRAFGAAFQVITDKTSRARHEIVVGQAELDNGLGISTASFDGSQEVARGTCHARVERAGHETVGVLKLLTTSDRGPVVGACDGFKNGFHNGSGAYLPGVKVKVLIGDVSG
jgi:hypothetical protein